MPAERISSRPADETTAARPRRSITPLELIAVLVVIAAVIAMAIWFIFFSSGGIGPGTV